MLNIESLAVDPKLASEGSWTKFAGAEFLIARNSNPKADQLRNQLFLSGDNMSIIQAGGEAMEKLAQEIDIEVMSQAILLDWKDVGDSKGKPIKYSPAVGKKFLGDEKYRDLHKFVENYSLNRANFRDRIEQDVAETVKPTAAS